MTATRCGRKVAEGRGPGDHPAPGPRRGPRNPAVSPRAAPRQPPSSSEAAPSPAGKVGIEAQRGQVLAPGHPASSEESQMGTPWRTQSSSQYCVRAKQQANSTVP